LNTPGSVSQSVPMVIGAFGASMRTPWRKPWIPVSIEKRDGVQVAAEQWPSVKRSPSLASLSRCGVGISFAPYAPTSA
jgi:hypothetical protein